MIVTLLTDFGTADHYVGVLKGVVLSRDPSITVVDLGHELAPGDVAGGAYALLAAYPYFPAGTVHVVVVDPGVGTERRVLVVEAAGQHFVGPDNGVFSYLLEREPGARVFGAVADGHLPPPVSTTFHGRDVFAPLGALLATGLAVEQVGTKIDDVVRLASLAPRRAEGRLLGRILHVDRFGNCVSSIVPADVATMATKFDLLVGARRVNRQRSHYAGAAPDELFAIWGSTGFLELSMNGASAAAALGVGVGDPVVVAAPEDEPRHSPREPV